MSSVNIISDTSADLSREEAEAMGLVYVPFIIDANDTTYIDDDTLSLEALYADMEATKEPIRTACPSPFHYKDAIAGAEAEEIFVVTISSKLSGSYNAAKVAVEEISKEHPEKKIALIDSKSAAAGTSNVVDAIYTRAQAGKDFETIKREVLDYVDRQHTFFILESMDNLIKNGRIPKLAGKAVNILNMKPVMRGEDGAIGLFQVNRGFKKSLIKLAKEVIRIHEEEDVERITISHSQSEDKAKFFKDYIQDEFKNVCIRIVQTKGLASVYADRGGIVVAL